MAYKDMFEIAISQGQGLRSILGLYFPIANILFVSCGFCQQVVTRLIYSQPDRATLTVNRCTGVIERVAGQLVKDKKQKILDCEKSGTTHAGKDLLSLLRKLIPLSLSIDSNFENQ